MKRAVAQVSREIADYMALGPRIAETKLSGDIKIPYYPVRQSDMNRWLLLLNPQKPKRVRRPISSRKVTIKDLDRLCRAIVFARDKATCQRCGKTEGLLDWAHVYARNNYRTRWSIHPPGSVVLCRACHFWWHHHPSETGLWFESHVGSKVSLRLHALHGGRGGRTDLSLVRLSLEREAKALGLEATK